MARSPSPHLQAVIKNTPLTRRNLLVLGASAAGLSLVGRPARAEEGEPIVITSTHQDHQAPIVITSTHQDHQAPATPATPMPMAAGEYPEIELVGTSDALTFPSTVSAGINHITVRNDSDTIMHTFTMRIPDGMSDDDAIAALAKEDPGDWFGTTFFVGTPDEPEHGGGELTGYSFYVPGHYMVVNPFSDGIVTSFDVAGDTWGRPAPVADIEIGLIDMALRGFEEPIPAGPTLWRVTNHGTTWHDVSTLKAPDGSTLDDLFAAFETAPEDQVFPDGYTTTGGVGATSPGVTTWVELDLEPGTHIAACFLPGEDGMPHAFHGMITAFEVA